MFRDFFLGFIGIHILFHANEEPIYGVGIMDEIKRHGYQVSPGVVYPLLNSLERQEFLKSSERVVQGKVRKYYEITEKGRSILEESKKKIRELVEEVLK